MNGWEGFHEEAPLPAHSPVGSFLSCQVQPWGESKNSSSPRGTGEEWKAEECWGLRSRCFILRMLLLLGGCCCCTWRVTTPKARAEKARHSTAPWPASARLPAAAAPPPRRLATVRPILIVVCVCVCV